MEAAATPPATARAVTLNDSLVIDAGAIETALAALTTDGTLAISDPNGVAGGALALRNAADSANTVYAYASSGNGGSSASEIPTTPIAGSSGLP